MQWTDVIFVMEPKHKEGLQSEFRQSLNYKRIDVLNIPDEYQFMDPELVEILRSYWKYS